MKTTKNLLHALFLVCLVAALPLSSVAATPTPAPPVPAEEDALPGPLGQRASGDGVLRATPHPRLGASALDPYARPAVGEDSWQRWPYGSPDQTFGYLSDVAWAPAAPGQPRQAWAVGFTTQFHGIAMRWDGRIWQRTPLPGGAGLMAHVSAISADDVWAAGESFIHWDGSAWTIGGTLQGAESDTVLTLQMLSPTLGFAGTFGGYLYAWDGSAWTRGEQISPLDVQTIHMFDARNGWAAGQQGVLLRCQNGVWSRVYSPVSHHLTSMSFVSPEDGWLVGTGGTFLHWDGHAWTPVRVPEATATLNVSMRTADDGWAVGELGKIFHWDGRAWTRVPVDDVEDILLTGVSAASSASAFIVGGNGALLRWDGRAWTVIRLNARAPLWIRDVRMTAAKDGWAVGDHGTLLRWDGSDWQPQDPIEEQPTLLTVDMFGPRALWMGGAGVLVYGEGNGAWRTWEVPAVIWSLDAVPVEFSVFAAGHDGAETPAGVIYTFEGQDWRQMDIPASPALYGIKMYSAGFGFAVGAQGTILRWDGASATWTSVDSPTDETLLSVEFISKNNWWAVGAGGTILHGDGETWTLVESPLPDHQLRTVRMTNLKFETNNDLWIGGEAGALLHYNWDAQRWDIVPSHTANTITGIGGELDGSAWAVGENGALIRYGPTYTMSGRVSDALSGAPLPGIELRAGEGVSVRTDAAGEYRFTQAFSSTYTLTLATPGYTYDPPQRNVTVPPNATGLNFTARRANSWKCWPGSEPFACAPNLSAVAPAGAGRAWAVGQGGAIFLWDGARWLRVVSPSKLNLTSVSATSPTDAWAVGGGGTVLHWDGRIWSQIDAGASVNLGAVAALAPDNVWIAGQDGLIRHWNGSTWQTVPSGTDDIIRSLSMLSPTEGWAAGGRVDSQTGAMSSVILHWNGQTWSQVFSPVEKPITAISMLSPTLGWAAGVDGILRWNGVYWALDPAASLDMFTGLAMHSPAEGWAVGFRGGQAIAVHWDGQTWQVTELGQGFELDSVTYLSDAEQLTVGLVGVTGRRQGAGPWVIRDPGLGDHGSSIDAINANDIWLATYGGDVLRWDGTQWLTQAERVAGVGYVIRAYAADDVWLGAANGYVGHWDGSDWTNLGEPTDKLINNIMKIGSNNVWAAGGRFVQQNKTGIPYPELMRWDGSTWTRPDIGDVKTMFSGMIHFGPNDIWVAGYDGHMLHWDGHTWTDSNIGGDEYILSLAGRAPNDIWGVGIGGRIVHYNGSEWLTVASPTQEQLGELRLLPDGTGWAVGWDITYFDGQQWRQEPSPTGKLLMSLALLSDHDGWAVGAEGVKLRLGPSYSAAGAVTDRSGEPLVGVELYSSQGEAVFTAVDGSYLFGDLAAGSVTITPTLKGWVFEPPSRTFTAPPAAEGLDFTARRVYRLYLPLVYKQY